jgi:hypothetical protein
MFSANSMYGVQGSYGVFDKKQTTANFLCKLKALVVLTFPTLQKY